MGQPILFSGHVIGLLKEYMRDLVDQAMQEQHAQDQFGFASLPYRPDQAISDMWTLCDEAVGSISNRIWLEGNLGGSSMTRARTRELTYRALIDFIESRSRERS